MTTADDPRDLRDAEEEARRLREAFELIAEYGVSDVRNFAKKVVSGLTASQALAQMIQENMRSRTREFHGGDYDK